MSKTPFGISFFDKVGCCSGYNTRARNITFKWLIFLLTFITYAAFHASRKPITVVKNVLNQNCTGKEPPPGVNASADPHWCDWAPFEGEDSNTLLGFLDSAYLCGYAFAMFFSGMLADRMDLRYFLSGGMALSAVFTALFGLAYVWEIHSLAYFLIIQIACGCVQASGWPGVVTVMGNWNGKGNRGLIFGIWNSHTSVGNILGSLMASAFVDTDWGLSFIVPAAFLAAVGLVDFLVLSPYPQDVGCDPPVQDVLLVVPHQVTDLYSDSDAASADESKALRAGPAAAHPAGGVYGSVTGRRRSAARAAASADELAGLISEGPSSDESSAEGSSSQADLTDSKPPVPLESPVSEGGDDEGAVSFFAAIRIPGVLPFSVCLFFAKLVSYTFLYWLPRYLHSAAGYSPSQSANLSTLFDMGGIIGGILAGLANDWTGTPGIVCVILLIIAIPMMFVYQAVATVSHQLNMLLLVLVGLLVNGPYALITTAVSADLGTSLRGNAKALATVTAIIDGTGSVGAALGPLLAGVASSGDNWTGVFVILMCSDAIAIASLSWVLRHEVRAILRRRRERLADAAANERP
ncbi:glucose-6-phosphate exchanger SLC37A2-like isoform X1 [Amphibalanus amphitrite]|uniref:glucose-6-phosphate exchanger SLC37A2-like isoform X1 n=1 Tax=Amphibalanus amphitrite TaxID=1232801 RepID=UPI001C928785|nr:glucose-6-phosphate exchanger SLC37A2-like isoform X1 [Amphibalanus amphitrite]